MDDKRVVRIQRVKMEFPNGPIPLKVKPQVETNRVVVRGPGAVPTPKGVPASIPTEFLIDTREAGIGDVQVLGSDNTPRKVKVQDGGDGTFRSAYVPADCGRYQVCVQHGGHEVPHSPFFVQPHSTGSAEKSKITEERNQNLRTGEEYADVEENKERNADVEKKPNFPLYNLYPMKIKEEVNDPDPDPPFFSLTSVVKSESDFGQLNTEYFDHSSVIQTNLKTETDDEERNCKDPLCSNISMGLDETREKYFQPVGQSPSEKMEIGDHPFCCLLCNQSFYVKEGCELQMTCEKCFTPPIEDKMTRTGDKKKPVRCDTCGKSFAQKSDLTKHIRRHTGEKPFKCKTCGKSFVESSGLTRHMRSHSGEKPYMCEICGRGFAVSSNLTRHKMCHIKDLGQI